MATNHKPLISLLGTKSLVQVPNVRLFRIKQRISMWKFDIVHCPGKTNFFADATSRNPVSTEDDETETKFLAANLAAIAITIEDVAAAAREDPAYSETYRALSAGDVLSPAKCKEYLFVTPGQMRRGVGVLACWRPVWRVDDILGLVLQWGLLLIDHFCKAIICQVDEGFFMVILR